MKLGEGNKHEVCQIKIERLYCMIILGIVAQPSDYLQRKLYSTTVQ